MHKRRSCTVGRCGIAVDLHNTCKYHALWQGIGQHDAVVLAFLQAGAQLVFNDIANAHIAVCSSVGIIQTGFGQRGIVRYGQGRGNRCREVIINDWRAGSGAFVRVDTIQTCPLSRRAVAQYLVCQCAVEHDDIVGDGDRGAFGYIDIRSGTGQTPDQGLRCCSTITADARIGDGVAGTVYRCSTGLVGQAQAEAVVNAYIESIGEIIPRTGTDRSQCQGVTQYVARQRRITRIAQVDHVLVDGQLRFDNRQAVRRGSRAANDD